MAEKKTEEQKAIAAKMFDDCCPNGQWWRDAWWENEKYRNKELRLQEVQDRINLLKHYFNKEWALSTRQFWPDNYLLRSALFGKGTSNLGSLMHLAKLIEELQDCLGFRSILKRFRKGEDSRSAVMESELAYHLNENGFNIRFLVHKANSPRIPDILSEKEGEKVVIESKALRTSKIDRQHQDYYYRLHDKLHDLQSKYEKEDLAVNFDLRDYVAIDHIKAVSDTERTDAEVARVHDLFKDTLDIIVSNKLFAVPQAVAGIGRCTVVRMGDKMRGEIAYNSVPSVYVENRLINNGISEAVEQLHSYYGREKVPGIAAVYIPAYEVDVASLQMRLSALAHHFCNTWGGVAGVIVFLQQSFTASHNRPLLMRNESFLCGSFPQKTFQHLVDTYNPLMI